jgi:DNA-binding NtrC family response regulator
MTQSNTELAAPTSFQEIREEVDCAARSDAKVLITGEEDSAKKIARVIHESGARRTGPFIGVNCAVLEPFLESELFGNDGALERARAGTLFLEKATQMTPRMQDELMRFLESGADVRIIAATDRSLYEDMLARRFREDLYYRLNVIHILLSPASAIAQPIELPAKIRQSIVATERRALRKAV